MAQTVTFSFFDLQFFMTMLFRGWQKRIKFFLDWSREKKTCQSERAQNCSCVLLSQWKKPDQPNVSFADQTVFLAKLKSRQLRKTVAVISSNTQRVLFAK